MRKFVPVFFLLLCSASLACGQGTSYEQIATKASAAEYNIKVHISATHIRPKCSGDSCSYQLYADVILNGKKIELSGVAIITMNNYSLIKPGDYPAKLTKDIHNPDRTVFSQAYDLLMTDGTVWHSFTTGISE